MHEEFIEKIRKAFTVGGDDAKRDAIEAMQMLLAALGAAPPPAPTAASSAAPPAAPPTSSPPVAATTNDPVSFALDAVIAKFRSMLPPGVEAPTVEPAFAIPFVPVPTWNHG